MCAIVAALQFHRARYNFPVDDPLYYTSICGYTVPVYIPWGEICEIWPALLGPTPR